MGRKTYTTFVTILALLLSYVGANLLVRILGENEQSLSALLLWGYAIPLYLLFGVLVGICSYAWYIKQSSVLAQLGVLLGLSLSIATAGPAVVYLTLAFGLWEVPW